MDGPVGAPRLLPGQRGRPVVADGREVGLAAPVAVGQHDRRVVELVARHVLRHHRRRGRCTALFQTQQRPRVADQHTRARRRRGGAWWVDAVEDEDLDGLPRGLQPGVDEGSWSVGAVEPVVRALQGGVIAQHPGQCFAYGILLLGKSEIHAGVPPCSCEDRVGVGRR